jgi:putative aldouronate transport system substrate-binding protein
VTLDVAVNYKIATGVMSSISYNLEDTYQGLDGHTYSKGDLAPAWRAISDKLNIEFVDKAVVSDGDTTGQWTRLLAEQFVGVDIVNGTGSNIGSEAIRSQSFVNIGNYLNQMPNLRAFLEANPSVKVSLTSADGGIYFTPYFDGLNEVEQMFLVRTDWVEDILDAASPAFDTAKVTSPITNYTRRQVSTPIDVKIKVAKDGGGTREVTKKYQKNILEVLKDLGANATGADYANAFKTHMQNTYGNQGYAKLSNVITGVDAAYDTDELVALLYVVKNNPKYLTRQLPTPLSSVEAYVPRENAGNRVVNLIRGMEMFGVRGVFSRYNNVYNDGTQLQDARFLEPYHKGVDDLNGLYQDGLIPAELQTSHTWRDTDLLKNSAAFMIYDYNDSSTPQATITNTRNTLDSDFHFQAILPPVIDWRQDGNYFHFTEAVRSVKNEAWGIPKHVEDDTPKLRRALTLVDQLYDYSTDSSVGTIHLYGPKGYTDGTIAYGGELADKVYKLSDACLNEIQTLSKGNRINYLRQYVGATLPIGHVRSMGLEYQGLSDDGKAGVERINAAVAAGTFRLAGISNKSDHWYDLSPTFFPFTAAQVSANTNEKVEKIFTVNSTYQLVKYGFKGGLGLEPQVTWSVFQNDLITNLGGINVNYYEDIYITNVREAYDRATKK